MTLKRSINLLNFIFKNFPEKNKLFNFFQKTFFMKSFKLKNKNPQKTQKITPTLSIEELLNEKPEKNQENLQKKTEKSEEIIMKKWGWDGNFTVKPIILVPRQEGVGLGFYEEPSQNPAS